MTYLIQHISGIRPTRISWLDRVLDFINAYYEKQENAYQIQKEREALKKLSGRELKDIGVRYEDAQNEGNRV